MRKPHKNSLPLAVCAAVIVHEGKVLLTKRPNDKLHGGYWEFPGGKIDQGESPHQAVIREIREELAINISVESAIKTVHHHYACGSVLIVAYLCRWLDGKIQHLEVTEHRWLTPEELNSFRILPADQPIVRELQYNPLHTQPSTSQ